MGTPEIIAASYQNASNVQVTTWQTSATENKDLVMSDVSSMLEIILQITRDVRSTKSYKRKHALYIQPGVTCSNIQTKFLHSHNCRAWATYKPTNQQTSDIQDLRNVMKSLFEQIVTMLNILTTT
jgi:hypothetical protein